MADGDWTDNENDLVVADYFSMLTDELRHQSYSKAEHNRALQILLPQRGRGSIEFKHQNVSAVLLGLGQPWITGYKPASRFQNSLVDAVIRWMEAKPGWLTPNTTNRANSSSPSSVREEGALWIGPPPTFANEPPPVDPEFMV